MEITVTVGGFTQRALVIGVAVLALAKPPPLTAPPGVQLTPIRTMTGVFLSRMV